LEGRADRSLSGPISPPAGTPEGAEGSPECGEGWRDLLDRACIRIRAALEAHGGSFRFTQIKEKYGTARLYWEGALSEEAEEKVDEAIDLAQARSACTCEQCGEPGRLFNRCACRKLNPGILVMQPAQDWATKNVPGAIDGARDRRIFLQR
jgi:hypothetical protein